jgi:hypothetical protein
VWIWKDKFPIQFLLLFWGQSLADIYTSYNR